MKKANILLSVIVLLLIYQTGLSQTRYLKKGNKAYFGYDYSKAISYFEAVKNKTLETERILANCYVKMYDFEKASTLYASIVEKPEAKFEDVWRYFQVLLKLEKYEEASGLISKLATLNPNDSRVIALSKSKDFHKKIKAVEPFFEINNLDFNNKQQDFGTAFLNDKVVFASTRKYSFFLKRLWNGNKMNYLNLYIASKNESGNLTDIKPFYKKINKKYHDGPVSFSDDGTLMAFTLNYYKQKSEDGTRNLQIFTSELVNGRWTEPLAFPYNNAEYSVGHASLTPDGRFMYFASDMPGGKGGTDIYKVERRKDGTWGKLINLEAINTEGDEVFPYYHKKGMLFFSSNGHLGLGGLDVFMTQVINDSYGVVTNLGVPINSSADDFALLLDKEMQKGYLSSNRKEGKGSDDIWYVNALRDIETGKRIKGVTKDKEDNIIAGAKVYLIYKEQVIDSVNSSPDGNFEFVVSQMEVYNLRGEKPLYEEGLNIANTNVPDEIIYADLVLNRMPYFSLCLKVTELATNNPIEGVKITVLNNLTEEETIVYSDKQGEYKTPLDDKKLNDRISYNFKFEKAGYITRRVTYNQILDREGEFRVHEKLDIMLREFKVGDDLANIFDINPIYFDLDKFNIRPDAAIELDKIVEIMNAYPNMVIELGSHTDCRASYAYNITLSNNRAKASAAYIKERISNPDRIYGKGYGESKLVNHCKCEGTMVVPCSEEEHQMNRRTEFRIVKN